ncbi:hypothetical protein C1G86_1161 [Dehalococcoides mccartyi]|uniref:Uncharacterized protein n=1 Tax=Dehalococcoides mccartyi TaxID=61435 RepID=A0A328ENR2_9CHLR|nr:hypothetical protein C1G86_1161 [Dehalococcoides mccartyi]
MRVMPSTACILEVINSPISARVSCSTTAIISYGPVTASMLCIPETSSGWRLFSWPEQERLQ